MAEKNIATATKTTTLTSDNTFIVGNDTSGKTNTITRDDAITSIKNNMDLGTAAGSDIGGDAQNVPTWGDTVPSDTYRIVTTFGGQLATVTQGSAFNKNFAGSGDEFGSANTVARSDHSHTEFDYMRFSFEKFYTGVTTITVDKDDLLTAIGSVINKISPLVEVELVSVASGELTYLDISSVLKVYYGTEAVSLGTEYKFDSLSISGLGASTKYILRVTFQEGVVTHETGV